MRVLILFLLVGINIVFAQDFSAAKAFCGPRLTKTATAVFESLYKQDIDYVEMECLQDSVNNESMVAKIKLWPKSATLLVEYINPVDQTLINAWIYEKDTCWIKSKSTNDVFARISNGKLQYPNDYLRFLTAEGFLAENPLDAVFPTAKYADPLRKVIMEDRVKEIAKFLTNNDAEESTFTDSADDVSIEIRKKGNNIASLIIKTPVETTMVSSLFIKDKAQAFSREKFGANAPRFDLRPLKAGFDIKETAGAFLLTPTESWSARYYGALKEVDVFSTPVDSVDGEKVSKDNLADINDLIKDKDTKEISILFSNGKTKRFRKITGEEQDYLFRISPALLSEIWSDANKGLNAKN